jgi:hypothetical protein
MVDILVYATILETFNNQIKGKIYPKKKITDILKKVFYLSAKYFS